MSRNVEGGKEGGANKGEQTKKRGGKAHPSSLPRTLCAPSPATCLINTLCNKVSRESSFKGLLVLKRVVTLSVRHTSK